MTIPLPRAEPGCKGIFSSACNKSKRSVVGAWRNAAVLAIVTIPIRTCGGWALIKSLIAVIAASIRLGLISSARILPEVSIASMMVSNRLGI